ncbi:nuclear pore-associated protein 1-like isoform X6 [Tamandua tetradactyla]|uniref:nuclear pore-associated protein 1-like isoform X6 n=1 Tax=Tamandua tetradactyla TaxID=48850 RepID=UPI004053C262
MSQPARIPAATYTLPFAPGAAPQPTFGVSIRQQLGAISFGPTYSLANLAAPPQAAGVSSPAAQPPSGSMTEPVFSGPTPPRFTFGIPVGTKRAYGNNTGPAALKGITGCGVSVPAPTPSSMSGALNFGEGPSGRDSITSVPQTPTIQGMPSARAVGGSSDFHLPAPPRGFLFTKSPYLN